MSSLIDLGHRLVDNKSTEADKENMLSWKKVPGDFGWFATSAKKLNLSYLTNCEEIEENFLNGCGAILEVNLQHLAKVTKIQKSFMHSCVKIRFVDFSAFVNVVSLGRSFLFGCTGLERVNLSGFSKSLKKVGEFFLHKCPKLTKNEYLDQVDFTPLLGLSENDIAVDPFEDKTLNARVVLQRVRAGGANEPKLACSSPTSASQSSPSSAPCQNCKKLEEEKKKLAEEQKKIEEEKKKLFDKLDCKDMQISKLKREQEGEREQHALLLNKQAERLRELSQQQQQQQQGGAGGNAAVLAERCRSLEASLAEAHAREEELKKEKTELREKNDKLLAKLLG